MHTYIHTVHTYTHTHSTYSQLSIYTATLERPTSPQARKNSSIIQPTDSTYIYRPLQLTAHQKSNAFQSTLSHLCRLCSATLRQCPSIQKSTHTQLYTYMYLHSDLVSVELVQARGKTVRCELQNLLFVSETGSTSREEAVRRVLTHTAPTTEACHCHQPHAQLYPTLFFQGQLHT